MFSILADPSGSSSSRGDTGISNGEDDGDHHLPIYLLLLLILLGLGIIIIIVIIIIGIAIVLIVILGDGLKVAP